MKVLLTGATSFTGYWFASALSNAGHHVITPLRGRRDSYEGLRRERISHLPAQVQIVENCPFGSERFLDLMRGGLDILCHHAADVTNYKSIDFDVPAALLSNTNNIQSILRSGRDVGLMAVVLTGSVFEAGEGAGSFPLRAFSPYGLSKGLTSEVFRFWCNEFEVPLAKFVISNPFGPWEEERFCAYLMRCWAQGKSAVINTPAYVRDNIHVSLLASVYANLVGRAGDLLSFTRLGPSGYVENQGAFARRFAEQMGRRLNLTTELQLEMQTQFPEPAVRINTDIPDLTALNWSEEIAWDRLADYYGARYLRTT